VRRQRLFWYAAAAGLVVAAAAAWKPAAVPGVAQVTGQNRPAHRMPTLTTLPQFPGIPLYAPLLNREKQLELIEALVDHKVSTWPVVSSRGDRLAKFTSTGIFGGFPPTEQQVARIAPNYDNILLGAGNSDLAPRFAKHNPDLTFFLYVDSGLNPEYTQADAGGVDEEDTEWIIENHPDWILQDKDGNLIRSRGGLSNAGEYWPDPGNRQWQAYFAEKISKLLRETGGHWDGVVDRSGRTDGDATGEGAYDLAIALSQPGPRRPRRCKLPELPRLGLIEERS
jgi:hypothetical protein